MKNFLDRLSDKLNEIAKLYKKKPATQEKSSPVKVPSRTTHSVQKVEIDIPTTTIIKVILIVAIFLTLGKIFVQLQTIITITLICFFLSLGLSPLVSSLEKHRIPRPLAILLIYLIFLGILGILFYSIVPILGQQLLSISKDLRLYFSDGQAEIPFIHELLVRFRFDPTAVQQFITDNLSSISRNLQSVAGSTFVIVSGIFQGVFNFIFALVVLFFLLMEREIIGSFILALFPERDRDYIREKTARIQNKMSDWFRGQLILMISVGTAMYVGMKILEYFFGMPYAATIGLLAGFMELFPYIGVLITGILSGLIALNVSWVLLLAVIGWIILVQFLEGNLLVPLVMERVTGLPSVVVILALAIGGVLGNALGGVPMAILGMILSIPIAASVGIFVAEYAKKKH
ncbi:AI-2E family transporter [Candidatus Gracilibacteria bacterium]|nr:AI-2E family transporter [Candidatus Gracilibacteria bacterium]